MPVRINSLENSKVALNAIKYSVFEVDEKGKYLRALETSIIVNNGEVELTEMLYFGKEIFQETVKQFHKMGLKGFWLHDHTNLKQCMKGLENVVLILPKENEETTYHHYEFV